MRLNNNNTYTDDFNNNVTFIRSGTGAFNVSRVGTSTFAADVSINGASIITFGQGGGTALFDGTVAQNINDALGTSATPDFYNLQVNKSAGDVTLNMPIRVRTTISLTSGNIISSSTNLLTMADNATVSAVSNASYVSGPVEKVGNDAFTFPVGDSSYYRPISISAPTNTSHAFRAQYFETNPHPTYNNTLKDASIDHISQCEYWILNRIVGSSNVTVTPSWDVNSCGVTNLANLVVARWNGTMWKDHGNGGTTGNTTAGTVATAAAVTSFSPFTLASTTINNPLPIELVSFNAKLNTDIVNLDWTTASEINNDYFTIEKSKDGIIWEIVSKQNGAGNSNTIINYADVDNNPYEGISFYRLKQTDFNGKYVYSNLVSINNSNKIPVTAYPNPVKDILTLSNLNTNDIIKIYNASGQIVFSGNSKTINSTNWSNGIYEIVITNSNGDIRNQIRIIK